MHAAKADAVTIRLGLPDKTTFAEEVVLVQDRNDGLFALDDSTDSCTVPAAMYMMLLAGSP